METYAAARIRRWRTHITQPIKPLRTFRYSFEPAWEVGGTDFLVRPSLIQGEFVVQEIQITIRTNFETDENEKNTEIFTDIVRQAAKTLYTQALMLSGKRKPQVAVQIGDDFYPPDQVPLFNPGEL